MSEENGYIDADDHVGRPDKADDSLAPLGEGSKGWKALIELYVNKDDPLPGRPDPIIAADVDLRSLPYMPLDVARLRDSGMANHPNPEVFRSAVLLWCASWHQVPAASLPNDDIELARYAGFGRDHQGWLSIREDALRGFTECSDGRLYHRVVAEKAMIAWDKKWNNPDKKEARSKQAMQAANKKWGSKASAKRLRHERLAEARKLGTHTVDEWKSLLNACGNACVKCDSKDDLVKDHITPIYQGGSDGIDNIQPLCRSCNSSKGPENIDHRPKGWKQNACETPAKRLPDASLKGREGKGIEEDKNSVLRTDAIASQPTYTDSRHELWGEGVPILRSLGVSESQSRSMIGKWLKGVKDDAQAVLSAIQKARDLRVQNAVPWITQALQYGGGNVQNRSGSGVSNPAGQSHGRANGITRALDTFLDRLNGAADEGGEVRQAPHGLLPDGRRK